MVNSDGTIIEKHSIPTLAHEGRDSVLQRIIRVAREINSPSEALGLGFPSVVHKGVVFSPYNMPGWDEVPLQDILEKELGVNVVVENDANAAALAEARLGAGRNHKDFLYVTLGTGVGGGIIVDGELYRGPFGDAGEIGRGVFYKGAPIEEFIGTKGIAGRYGNKGVRESGSTGVTEVATIDARARDGEPLAKKVLEETGYALGLGLCTALAVLGMRVVVLGGGISRSDIVVEAARKAVRENAIATIAEVALVQRARFVEDTGLIGASLVSLWFRSNSQEEHAE